MLCYSEFQLFLVIAFFSLACVSVFIEIKSGISFEIYKPCIFIIYQLTSATLNENTTLTEKNKKQDCKNSNWYIQQESIFLW